jgi:glycosyltransferase involved in cell wall biosynthesis
MNKSIKVCFIIDGLSSGGKERQLVELIKRLKNNPVIELGIITFNENKHYSEEVKGLIPLYTELKKRPTRLEPFFTIWKCFFNFKPDVVHTWDSLASMYSYITAKTFKSKIVDGSIRDSGIEKGWQLFIKRFFLKRADLVLSNSYAGLKYYGFPGEVLHNAIDLERFHNKTESSECNMIMVANFTDYKDHETFINASLELVKSNLIDQVYLAGDGPYWNKYYDLININHKSIALRFHFLGSISNVEEYLAKCRFGILCSTLQYGEGISNSVLEYMAAEVIAISTNVGGMKEVIDDGINGFLVDPKDSGRIVEIIKTLRNDTKSCLRITENGRKTIEKKFSYEENISKLIDIYSKLCTGK